VRKHWAIKLARVGVCLLAGAAVTWGVAWGFGLKRNQLPPPMTPNIPKERPPGAPEWHQIWEFADRGRTVRDFVAPWKTEDEVRWRIVTDYGWPLRSLRHDFMMETVGGEVVVSTAIDVPAPWTSLPGDRRFLPMVILPLGFALNTLLAAGVLLGVVESFAFARGRRRRRKGRCFTCGYDRSGIASDAPCPECGGVRALCITRAMQPAPPNASECGRYDQ